MWREVYGLRRSPLRRVVVRWAWPINAAGRAGGPLRRAQAGLCHAGDAPYRCFLPDLTRFGAPAAQDPGSSQRAVAGRTTALPSSRFLSYVKSFFNDLNTISTAPKPPRSVPRKRPTAPRAASLIAPPAGAGGMMTPGVGAGRSGAFSACAAAMLPCFLA